VVNTWLRNCVGFHYARSNCIPNDIIIRKGNPVGPVEAHDSNNFRLKFLKLTVFSPT
jgi:hypothetical protein